MRYSIEQIRSVRDIYTQLPYPGFSLEEVVKRRKASQAKFVKKKNPNAWVAKGTAKTAEEWVTRLVRSNLNKISASNAHIILDALRVKEIFDSPDTVSLVVSMIFEKALNEPENSRLYASLCRQLAFFEMNEVHGKQSDKPGEKSRSSLRDAIVEYTQKEFKEFRFIPEEIKGITKEELKDAELVDTYRSNFIRRKRANMRFVGELYLNNTLTHVTALKITEVALSAAKNGGFPLEENIELLSELFTTVGEKLDSEKKGEVDRYFTIFQNLIKSKSCPYSKRIVFQIMNLIDLRKTAWGTKVPKEKKPKKTDRKKNKPAVTTAKRTEGLKSWQDLATHSASPTSAPTTNAPAPKEKPSEVSTEPLIPFESRVHSMLDEWVSHRVNDFITDWMDEFAHCDREFASEEELVVAVGVEVINKACLTTKKDAQREAYSFLVVGLYLTDEEIMQSFATAAIVAHEEGYIEDAPKYPERFMLMLRYSSDEEDVTADTYFDAATVLIRSYNQVTYESESEYEYLRETLMEFWKKVPAPPPAEDETERVVLGKTVLFALCSDVNDGKPGVELLIAKILDSLQKMGVVPPEEMEEFLEVEDESLKLYTKVAALCRN